MVPHLTGAYQADSLRRCCPNLNVAPPSWRLNAGWKPALHLKLGQHQKPLSRTSAPSFVSAFISGSRQTHNLKGGFAWAKVGHVVATSPPVPGNHRPGLP